MSILCPSGVNCCDGHHKTCAAFCSRPSDWILTRYVSGMVNPRLGGKGDNPRIFLNAKSRLLRKRGCGFAITATRRRRTKEGIVA